MKAVNLLPVEARHASGNVTLRGASPATLGLLGGLALALVVAFGYVALANGIADRRTELATVNAQTSAAQQRAAALKPYGDLESLRSATMDHVRALAGGRYDWPVVLSRFARALPADATLTTFNGTTTGTAAATSSAAGAVSGGPTVTLNGCTASHSSVGSIMDRLRAVQSVSDVTLQSSTIDGNAGAAATAPATSGDCGRAETFALTVTLDALPGAAAANASATAPAVPATAPGTTTSSVPATTTTPSAAPAPSSTTPATTQTTTTPGGTP